MQQEITQILYTLLSVSSKGKSYLTVAQYHNQETDIDTIHLPY